MKRSATYLPAKVIHELTMLYLERHPELTKELEDYPQQYASAYLKMLEVELPFPWSENDSRI